MNHIQLLLFYLPSHFKSIPPFLHCLTPSLFRWRHDGSPSRLSNRGPFDITVDLDSSPSVGVRTPTDKKLPVLFYSVPDFISSCFLFLDVWFLDHPCTSFSLSKLLSNKQSVPSYIFFLVCPISAAFILRFGGFFSVLLLRQSWFVLCLLFLIVLFPWLPGYRWLWKTLYHKTPLPVS